MRRVLLIFILCSISLFARSQWLEYGVGVRGGIDWNFMWLDPFVNQPNMPLTYNAGVQFRMISEKYFGFKVELNYAQRGFKDSDGHRRFDFVELPFMTHITFGKKLFRFFIDLGPFVAYMVNESHNEANSPQHYLPIKNKFDYGLVGGLGFEFNTKYGIYTIDGRYNFGLANVFGNSSTGDFKTSSNQNISVSIAYLFPIRP